MKVLIADDELRLRKVVSLHLKKSGFEVIEAGNGLAAVQLAEEHSPDVIVLDVMMPEKTGLEACAELKKMDRFKQTPIILLTAMAESEDLKKGEEAGADAYLTKPFSPKELIDIIKSRTG
ncbi:response regulator receiver protein [Denitrovibrio acetiphilus DSM 12809]|uniref:Response regulator receiver protein n=1 Tax=Denitrovibrio acetiphilus (strain DSM 12809 / NBRC 114555 / N2460) TaxID=522772 RepID=D4H5L7_DENA2|nr:response regulator [Denitrovibrio acetiphilus]ADD69458.1 response regulator receiver protein [Denitrovibrio acetiphilus DSM 12809]